MISKIYDFIVKDIHGKDISLDKYKNKVMLIVNVASKCGYTKQYEDLEKLYLKYKNDGLCILAFPCNQFFNEEPENDAQILSFCQTKYNVTFDIFSKIKVNSDDAIPLYKYLKEAIRITPRAKNIKWNFEKFLIDKKGIARYRIESSTKPFDFEDKIKELLSEN
ncbi:MAG: glutathione peroxidase [Malacoplasma sp.]